VLILKGVKVFCFDTLLQVLILNGLCRMVLEIPGAEIKKRQKGLPRSEYSFLQFELYQNGNQRQEKLRQMSNLFGNGPFPTSVKVSPISGGNGLPVRVPALRPPIPAIVVRGFAAPAAKRQAARASI
jgi:hypothetical protein